MSYTKEFFQKAWGPDGYYETFSYGVGIKVVYYECIEPFLPIFKGSTALEIGPGGGAFTERLIGKFDKLIAVDVIKMPDKFKDYKDFRYIELPDQSTDLPGIYDHSVDFCFCYGLFCHLPNNMIAEYLKSVRRVLKKGGDFVFMLSHWKKVAIHSQDINLVLGDLCSNGHYYQDERTLPLVIGEGWEIISPDMIPEHRDIIVHLKKR